VEEELKKLIEYVVEQKAFLFLKDDVPFYYDELLANGILVEHQGKLAVNESASFTQAMYEYFSSRYGFELSNNFNVTVDFYNKILQNFIVENKIILGFIEQKRNLLIYLIKASNRGYGETFKEFILSLNKILNGQFLYAFTTAFFKCLDELDIDAENLYASIRHLHEQVVSDAYYNLNVSEVISGIQTYCRKNSNNGEMLLNIHDKNENSPIVNIQAAILVGLYHNNPSKEIERIKELAKREINHQTIACAAFGFYPKDEEEGAILLDVLDSIKSTSENYLINLPRIYGRFLRNENITKVESKMKCFQKIQALLDFDLLVIKKATLWELQFVEGHQAEVFEIIDSLNESVLDDNLYKSVNEVLAGFSEQKYFFQFLRRFSVNNKLKFESKSFNLPISKFKKEDPMDFSKNLIQMLIDNDGGVRFIGKRILSHLTIVMHPNYNFGYDILNLSALDQYKLWVVVFQGTPEPKYTFPLLLPLRKSKYPFVREAFICKLEELIESYTSSVMSVLKEHLDLTDDEDNKLLQRIELRNEEFNSFYDKKVKVKELNPLYTQAELYELYQEGFGISLSKSVEDSVEKNSSVIHLFKTITLAKGGGWKHNSGGQVSQLSNIEVSFQLPREYYIKPELFDYENRSYYLVNWENEFREWEAIISSLENI